MLDVLSPIALEWRSSRAIPARCCVCKVVLRVQQEYAERSAFLNPKIERKIMKSILPITLAVLSLSSCDVKVDKSEPPSKTTVITPEKKVEKNTTIINPPKP